MLAEDAHSVAIGLLNLNLIDGNGLADNPSGTTADDHGGTLTVSDSTLSGNSAVGGFNFEFGVNGGFGGGIDNEFGPLTISNSTLSATPPAPAASAAHRERRDADGQRQHRVRQLRPRRLQRPIRHPRRQRRRHRQ